MKKLSFICFILLFAITACKALKENERVAHSLMNRVTDILESRYQLHYVGFSEGGEEGKYSNIGLHFVRYGTLSKDEGRKMVIESVKELLNEINSDPKLQPFLLYKPFTAQNVSLDILIFTSDGKNVFYPDINIFSAVRGKIKFFTKIPEREFGYFTEEEETFEEALRIVEAQNQENQSAL